MSRRLALACLALAAVAVHPVTAVADEPLDGLKVSPPGLTDSKGRQVVLHGVNAVYKESPHYPSTSGKNSFNLKDVKRLRSWGFNTVRLGVAWAGLQPKPGAISQPYAARIDQLVKLAGERGIYVLVDMHQDMFAKRYEGNGAPAWAIRDDGVPFVSLGGFPTNYVSGAVGRAFSNFWENKDGVRSQFSNAFAELATRFRGRPYVLGYDTWNEPFCEVSIPECGGFNPKPSASASWLQPFYAELIPKLATADPTHPAFYEEFTQVNLGYPFHIGYGAGPWPFPDTTGLSYHVYCSLALRSDANCSRQEPDAIQGAVAAAKHNKVAAISTEFGASDDLKALARTLDLFDRYGQSWQYWQYKAYDDPTTIANSAGGLDSQSVVDVKGKPKLAKLKLLARARPDRIAGTNASWRFSPRTGKFTLSYKPTIDSETTVSLPLSIHYPHGYNTKVVGGHVVSKSGSALVRIARAGAAVSRVSISVTPRT